MENKRASGGAADMDDTDRAILNRIQSDFPITSRPYRAIAQDLGLGEDELIRRLRRLKDRGIIRRIGGNFSPDKLGFVSTLCAARVQAHQQSARAFFAGK